MCRQNIQALEVLALFSENEPLLHLKQFLGTLSEWRGMSEVNIIALNHCTQLAVKSMMKVPNLVRVTCVVVEELLLEVY